MTSVQIIQVINLNNPNKNQDLWHKENVLLAASYDHEKEKYLHTYVTNNTYKTSKQHFFLFHTHEPQLHWITTNLSSFQRSN
jgi:hypothetical protein